MVRKTRDTTFDFYAWRNSSAPSFIFLAWNLFLFYYLIPKDEVWLFSSKAESLNNIKTRNIWERCSFRGVKWRHSQGDMKARLHISCEVCRWKLSATRQEGGGSQEGRMTNSSFDKHSLSISLDNYRTRRNLLAGPIFLRSLSGAHEVQAWHNDCSQCGWLTKESCSCLHCPAMTMTPQLTAKIRWETPKMRSSSKTSFILSHQNRIFIEILSLDILQGRQWWFPADKSTLCLDLNKRHCVLTPLAWLFWVTIKCINWL